MFAACVEDWLETSKWMNFANNCGCACAHKHRKPLFYWMKLMPGTSMLR